MAGPSYYEILGVEPSASEAEIKSAFRQEALRNHPDQGGNSALFRLVEDAYNTLSSPSRRAAYDESHGYARTSAYAAHGGQGFEFEEEERPTGQWSEEDWNDSSWQGDQATSWTDREPAATTATTTDFRVKTRYRVIDYIAYMWDSYGHLFFVAVMVWVLLALAFNWVAVPGLKNSTVLQVAVVLSVLWLIGSPLLRFVAFCITAIALWGAYADRLTGLSAALLLAIALVIWLAGHWIFLWKNGFPRSAIALGMLNNLPGILNPLWKWGK